MNEHTEHLPEPESAILNQTAFGEEEPLFQDGAAPASATMLPGAPTEGAVKSKLQNPVVFIGGAVAIVIFLLLFIVAFLPREMPQFMGEESPSPTVEAQAPSELDKRLQELENDLKANDPTKQDLPFPPIDMKLFLDKP